MDVLRQPGHRLVGAQLLLPVRACTRHDLPHAGVDDLHASVTQFAATVFQAVACTFRCGNVAAILELDESLNKNFKVGVVC